MRYADGASVRLAPDSWRPDTATPAELAYFGIPQRPAAGAGLAAWTNDWVAHYTGMRAPQECASLDGVSAGTSPTWAGVVANPGGVTETYGTETIQPNSPCGGTDSYVTWVGIGGFNNNQLLQNGFFFAHTLGSFAFYQAIDGTLDTHATPVTFPWAVGDTVNESTTYTPSTGTVHFGWHDLTNGKLYPLDKTSFVINNVTYAASRFWSAANATGEAIDERGQVDGKTTTLRNFGVNNWSNAQVSVNGGALQAIRSVAHTGYNMQKGSLEYAYVVGGASLSSYANHWLRCGTAG